MNKSVTTQLSYKCFAIIIWGLLVLPLLAYAGERGPVNSFKNLCPNKEFDMYCRNVGKRAYNAVGAPAIRNIDLGPIVGVTFLNAGALMTGPDRSEMRFARERGFYYIIGPGGVADYYFLRYSREINPR